MPAFLDVHLEQVAQVIEAGRGGAQVALLLHRGGLGVALDDDQPLQLGPVLPRHLLPGGLTLVLAEPEAPVRVALGQEELKQAANFEAYNPPRATTGMGAGGAGGTRPVPASPSGSR